MTDSEQPQLDPDLRLRLSQEMVNRSLRPVPDPEMVTLLARGGDGSRSIDPTLTMDEGMWRVVQEADALTPGVGLPKQMSGAQEWVLLPLSDAPEGVIGVGGEGVVYSYVQRELGREVAVKTLRADRWSYAAIKSLLREACVTARLEHPNIVPVHYLHLPEHDGDSPYWVMKRIRGKPLTEHLPSGEDPWPFDRLLDVFRRILDAVAFAHSKGIVHRDLKPDNILVGEFGEVQVTDWGLAVAVSEEGARDATPLIHGGEISTGDGQQRSQEDYAGGGEGCALSPELAKLNDDVRSGRIGAALNTSAGGRAGTPVYMAPEQLQITADGIGECTDVFLLGGILYSMLTGQPPHQLAPGDDTQAAKRRLEQIRSCSALPSVAERRRQCGLPGWPKGMLPLAVEGLAAIAVRALSCEPAGRFPRVRAFQAALDEWESRSSSQDLYAQARVRLAELESAPRPDVNAYVEAMALAKASLESWPGNERAQQLHDKISALLRAAPRRPMARVWSIVRVSIAVIAVVGFVYCLRTRRALLDGSLINRGRERQAKGDHGSAEHVGEETIALDIEARLTLASLLCSFGRHRESREALQPLLSMEDPGAKALLVAALCSQALGRGEEAGNYVKMATRKTPPAAQTREAIADLLELGIDLWKPLESLLHSDDALRVRLDVCLALGYTTRASRLIKGDDEEKIAAIQACRTALDLAPDRTDVQKQATAVYYELGLALSAKGDDAGAVQQYRRAIEINADYSPPHYALAWLLEREGKYGEAADHWQTYASLARRPDRWRRFAVHSYARLLVKLGREEEAIEQLERWLKQDDRQIATREALAIILYSVHRYADAQLVTEPLLSASNPSPKALLLGVLCTHGTHKTEETHRLLVRMLDLPMDAGMGGAFADVLEMGVDLTSALPPLSAGNPPLEPGLSTRLALGYMTLASRLAQRKEETEAAQACKTALRLAPHRADVQSAAGYVFYGLGMHEDYAQCYSNAAEMAPEQANNHGNLGWALYLGGRYDEAMTASLRALELDPKLAYVHANVGLLHVLKRDLDKAMPSYEKAVELGLKQIDKIAITDLLDLLKKRPEISEAHYALAFCYEKKGEKAKAREHYQKYVDAAKEGKFVELAKQRVEELETGQSH